VLFEHTLSRIDAEKDNAWALDVCGLGGTLGLKLVILGDCLTCSMTESKLLSRINIVPWHLVCLNEDASSKF
jgi:sulfur transfer complex TusBCD TusB component (DsrH family)